MRIRIVDVSTNESFLYNVDWEEVRNSLYPYEYIHLMDDELLNIVSIEMAVHKLFGKNTYFKRNTTYRDFIYGSLHKGKHKKTRPVLIFFEA